MAGRPHPSTSIRRACDTLHICSKPNLMVSQHCKALGPGWKWRCTCADGYAMLCSKQLYERFRPGQTPPKSLGPSRDYNVDMVPKFILSGGELVRFAGASELLLVVEESAVPVGVLANRAETSLAAC